MPCGGLAELASVLLLADRLDEADALQRRAGERAQRADVAANDFFFASLASGRAKLAEARNDDVAAIAQRRRALDVLRQCVRPGNPQVQFAAYYLGRSLLRVGRFEEALGPFEEVVAGGLPLAILAHATRGTAHCLWKLGELDWAAERYREACVR